MTLGITYSTDGTLNLEDISEASRLSEGYFGTHNDPKQLRVCRENELWILNHIPDCLNIIKSGTEVIGFSFVFPSNNQLMGRFLSGEINEAELFEGTKRDVDYHNMESVYLCAVYVIDEFRGRGLSVHAFSRSLDKITAEKGIKPTLFYWAYSSDGDRIAKGISRRKNLDLRSRIFE